MGARGPVQLGGTHFPNCGSFMLSWASSAGLEGAGTQVCLFTAFVLSGPGPAWTGLV